MRPATTCRSPSRIARSGITALIDEAEALLAHAATMGVIGRYQLEAAVQSAHAARRRTGRTDWAAIRAALRRAACGRPARRWWRSTARWRSPRREGAAAGLAALDVLGDDKRLDEYQPYWAARAGLLAQAAVRCGRRPTPMSARSASNAIRRCAASCRENGLRSEIELRRPFQIGHISCAVLSFFISGWSRSLAHSRSMFGQAVRALSTSGCQATSMTR